MSQENVENFEELFQPWDGRNLREFSEAWGSGDIDLSILAPDVAYEDTILPDHVGETYRGHDAWYERRSGGPSRSRARSPSWTESSVTATRSCRSIEFGVGQSTTGIEFEAEVAYACDNFRKAASFASRLLLGATGSP